MTFKEKLTGLLGEVGGVSITDSNLVTFYVEDGEDLLTEVGDDYVVFKVKGAQFTLPMSQLIVRQ